MLQKKSTSRLYGILAIVTGVIGFCLLVLPYMFFPQFYNPKANSSMGYTSPATIEGWALMILGLCFIGITIVLRVLYKNRNN